MKVYCHWVSAVGAATNTPYLGTLPNFGTLERNPRGSIPGAPKFADPLIWEPGPNEKEGTITLNVGPVFNGIPGTIRHPGYSWNGEPIFVEGSGGILVPVAIPLTTLWLLKLTNEVARRGYTRMPYASETDTWGLDPKPDPDLLQLPDGTIGSLKQWRGW